MTRSNFVLCMWVCIILVAAGCTTSTATIDIPPTAPSPRPTETATPTIVWFPPTATHALTPAPMTATPDQSLGIGNILFEDDFSQAEGWTLATKDGSGAAFGKNELTIAIAKQNVYVSSLRNAPKLTDFYLEITANPTLCGGLDEYGLLLRAASDNDYYRYSLSCDGQVRLDRVFRGNVSSPQPWTLSGAVPIGAPSMLRLGVWASGSEMRFYINDMFQFSVQDRVFPNGLIGVYARSARDAALTVNFSDLKIYEISP